MNTILFLSLFCESDSLAWDIAKQAIQTQQTLAIYGVSVLIGITLLILGVSWIYNIILHKREVHSAIAAIKINAQTELKKDFDSFLASSKITTDEAIKEVEQTFNEKIIETERMNTFHINNLHAEKSRIFAIVCRKDNDYVNSTAWWAESATYYAKIKNDEFLRLAVDNLNLDFKEALLLKQQFTERQINLISNSLAFIPPILQQEKEEIASMLSKVTPE